MAAEAGSSRHQVAAANGLPEAPVLSTRAARGTGMAFVEIDVPYSNSGATASLREDAFLVVLQMSSSDFDLYADGRLVRPEPSQIGDIAIFDLRENIASDSRDPYHGVDLYIPQRALLTLSNDGDIPRHVQELHQTFGHYAQDDVTRHLLLAMRPALAARPEETSELFVDHVSLALAVHVAGKYGDGGLLPRQWLGGLAPWQERRAKELIDASIEGGMTLNDLAKACELSTRHFARAFRQSTGMAPYQWLQQRRIDRAKHLLENSGVSLSDVAADCGFADQSHFTRIFSRVSGMTPRTWRRTRRE